MDITLTINDDRLQEIIQNQIDGISPDDLKNVVMEGLEKYMTDHSKELVESLFFKTEHTIYGYNRVEESEFTRNMLKQLDYSKLQPIVDKMIDIMANNYRHILVASLSEILVNGMMNTDSAGAIIRREAAKHITDMMSK